MSLARVFSVTGSGPMGDGNLTLNQALTLRTVTVSRQIRIYFTSMKLSVLEPGRFYARPVEPENTRRNIDGRYCTTYDDRQCRQWPVYRRLYCNVISE